MNFAGQAAFAHTNSCRHLDLFVGLNISIKYRKQKLYLNSEFNFEELPRGGVEVLVICLVKRYDVYIVLK